VYRLQFEKQSFENLCLRNKVSVVYRLQFEKQSFENVSLRNKVSVVYRLQFEKQSFENPGFRNQVSVVYPRHNNQVYRRPLLSRNKKIFRIYIQEV